ncbi:MAG: archaellin/type IV pilin N-terminal domain-containing protein [Thermoplasmata archaeon]
MSPIIATILLVAITVVLAAVLYILISGLTKGPGNTPLGTAFNTGTPQNIGVATAGTAAAGCTAGDNCYQMAIAEASGGVTTTDLQIQIKTPTGAFVGVTTITVLSISGTPISHSANAGSTWNASTPLDTTQTIVVDVTAPAFGTSISGDTLVFLGVGSFSGQVSVTL